FILPADFMPGGTPGEFIAIKAGQTWNAMSQVQLNQQIFNQQVFTGLKAAKTSEEYYKLAALLAEENLIQQVATNYYQVIITRQQLNVIDANLERTGKLEQMVSSQYELGLAKKIDLDRIRVNRSNLVAQREQLTYAVTQQENLLKYYMGMPVTEPIQIADAELTQLESQAKLEAASRGVDVERLTSYQLLRKQEELLGQQRKAYISEYFPTLSLGGNYTYMSQSDKLNVYSNRALNYDMSAVTLTLRIPIFDGFARRSKVNQANVELLKVHEDLRSQSNALTMA